MADRLRPVFRPTSYPLVRARFAPLRLTAMAAAVTAFAMARMPAQSAATPTDQVAVASIQGQGEEPWTFVFDVATSRLAAYKSGAQGLELRGVRDTTWDLQLEELDPRSTVSGPPLSVRQVRKAVEAQGGAGPHGGGATGSAPKEGKRKVARGVDKEIDKDVEKGVPKVGEKKPLDEAPATARSRAVVLTATQGAGGEPWVQVYDASTQTLASYRVRGKGIELAGVRTISWDLRLTELRPGPRSARVVDIKKAVEEGKTGDDE